MSWPGKKYRAGVTKAAIYWYFPNKDALVGEVAQSIYDTYIGYIEKISGSPLESYAETQMVKTLIRNGEFQTDLPLLELTKFIDGLAFQNLLVSKERPEVSRTIILSVLEHILHPIHPSPRKEVSND